MISIRAFAVLGLLLAGGLALFGYQVGQAVKLGRDFDRYFSVRGLSEREVKATLVIWPLQYVCTGETLGELRASMDQAKAVVTGFLLASGIEEEEISHGLPEITDTISRRNLQDVVVLPRYNAEVNLVVRSRDIDTVLAVIRKSEALIELGVPLIHSEYENRIEFIYDQLATIKPGMIEEATANARQAAEKFAEDSHSKVGAIRKASQGVVDIQDRDIANPEIKKIRVVTTIEFFIE